MLSLHWIAVVFSFSISTQAIFQDSEEYVPFQLDEWDSDGDLTLAPGTRDDLVRSIHVQADGKILVAGSTQQDPNLHSTFIVSRLMADGSIDTAFGTGGHQMYQPFGGFAFSHSVTVQEDGKVVTAGRFWGAPASDTFQWSIQRYLSTGGFDTTFSTDGRITLDIDTRADFARDVAIQTDGKLVIAGYGMVSHQYDFAVARVLSNGVFDTSFSSDGLATTPIGTGADAAYGLALQTDGKIVLAGKAHNGTNNDFAVARFFADGTLDTTFSTDGVDSDPIGAGDDTAWDVTIDVNGYIVLVGRSNNGSNFDFAISVWNSDGSKSHENTFALGTAADSARAVVNDPGGGRILVGRTHNGSNWDFGLIRTTFSGDSLQLDTSFSNDGYVVTSIGATDSILYGIALQTDSRPVVVGFANTDQDILISRYTTGGVLDTAFSSDGIQTTAVDASEDDVAYDVAIQPNDRIVVAGTVTNGTEADFVVLRYLTNGSLDSSFSNDGIVRTDLSSVDNEGFAVIVATDGDIVVSGETDGGTHNDIMVTRYTSSGVLDTAFANDGIVSTDISTSENAGYDLVEDGNGRIVVSSYRINGGEHEVAAVRYTAAGVLDTAFASDGIATANFGATGEGVGFAILLQTDGKVVVGGHGGISGASSGLALARFESDGNLDSSFSSDGVTVINAGSNGAYYTELNLRSDGKIIGYGRTLGIIKSSILTQINANGETDVNFGSSGSITFSIDTAGDEITYAAVLNAGNEAHIAGATFQGDFDNFVAKYEGTATATEILDTTFGTNGITTTSIGTGDDVAVAAHLYGGLIFAAGRTNNGNNFDFALARYTTGGSIVSGLTADSGFDSDGIALLDSGTGTVLYDAVVDGDMKIVVTGVANRTVDPDMIIARYLTSGTLDTAFSNDGILTINVGSDADAAYGMVLQTDSKYVIAGQSNDGGDLNFAIARILTDGTLDTSFSSDGLASADFSSGDDDIAYDVAQDGSGRLILVGVSDDGTDSSIAISRFETDGVLDTAFSSDGLAIYDLTASSEDYAYAVALETDGDIIAAGRAFSTQALDMLVLRALTNGTLDTSFANDGIVTLEADSGANFVFDVEVQPSDDQIVIAGREEGPNPNRLVVARYTTAGVLDTAFSADGIVATAFGTGATDIFDLRITQKGSLFLSGIAKNSSTDRNEVGLMRFDSDGDLDSTFSADGRHNISIGTNDATAYALALTSSEKIVVVGRQYDGSEDEGFVAVFWP